MGKFIRRGVVLASMAFMVIVTIILATVPHSVSIEIFNGLLIGLTVSVAVVFWDLLWAAFTKRPFDSVSQAVVAISGLWGSFVGLRICSVVGRATGTMAQVNNSPGVAFFCALACGSGLLLVTSTGTDSGKLMHNKRLILTSVILGIVLTIGIIAIQKPGI